MANPVTSSPVLIPRSEPSYAGSDFSIRARETFSFFRWKGGARGRGACVQVKVQAMLPVVCTGDFTQRLKFSMHEVEHGKSVVVACQKWYQNTRTRSRVRESEPSALRASGSDSALSPSYSCTIPYIGTFSKIFSTTKK